MDISNANLRQFLNQYFDSDELDDLCFDYFPRVQQEFTSSMTKSDQIRLLLTHCRNHGERDRLIGALRESRPGPFQREFELTQPEPAPAHATVTPPNRDPRQIFISHAYEDARLAHRLAHDLGQRGWQVWIAPDSIRPGEKWVDAINRGLVESGIFLLLISEHALQSRWVKSETSIAIQWEHEGKLRFIPLQTSSRPLTNIPAMWQAYQFIPFAGRYQNGFDQLLAKLEERSYTPPPTPSIWQRLLDSLKRIPKIAWGSAALILVAFLFISWLSQLAVGGIEPTTVPLATTTTEVAVADTATNTPTTDPNIPPANANLHDTWTRPTDGMTMVYVPGGTFMMGSDPNDDTLAQSDEQPQHEVRLDSFWIDQQEVNNAQFAAFLKAEGNQAEGGVTWLASDSSFVLIEETDGAFWPKTGFDDHPVIVVSWYGATAYCQWGGGALPTEAQWEYAARGTDERIYPWDNEQPNRSLLNYNSIVGGTTAVGSYSPQGDSWVDAQDMAGNVWEWVTDWYDADYYDVSPTANPTGPNTGVSKVLRGGGWNGFPVHVRSAYRSDVTPDFSVSRVGFRCVVLPGN